MNKDSKQAYTWKWNLI